MSDVTRILSAIEQGDPRAADELLPVVYEELRKLAAARMAQEKPGQTLQATALVHEAYLRLVKVDEAQHWDSRGHFFAAAAEAMRRILVERARRKAGPKAGGQLQRVELSQVQPEVPSTNLNIVALNEALDQLESEDTRAATIIKLRFFLGLTNEQTAEVLGISASTAKADWTYAKNWLRATMLESSEDDPHFRNL